MNKEFTEQLAAFRSLIDADIAAYAAHVRRSTPEHYGEYGLLIADAFLDMLERGGKRLRGALVMTGYEMCGGKDKEMIVRAATAIEMFHAHWLIIDDIQDRSDKRRGKPTIHTMLADYHRKQKLRGDADHAGVSLAINAGIAGGHAAQVLLAGLNVEAELRSKVLGILNQASLVTAYGQTYDIMNEQSSTVLREYIERTMEWKTAYYTFLNPLCVGMVLAGAGCEDTDAIRVYALLAGRAFQITDDLIGVFGVDKKTGKTDMDDIREGKRTLLTEHVFEQGSPADKTFLEGALGNDNLTRDDFMKCQEIMIRTGARGAARAEAQKSVDGALAALAATSRDWRPENVSFLRELALSMVQRIS